MRFICWRFLLRRQQSGSIMQVLILGAGRVGQSVAGVLVTEDNDITVVDRDAARLRELEQRLELRGVAGNGIYPSVLREAGLEDADLFIACTSSDDTNLVACKVAHDSFGVPTTIARLSSPEYAEANLLGKEGFAVDYMIRPEESVTRYLRLLIDYPEALQVIPFSQGEAHLAAVRVASGGGMAGRSIAEFRRLNPDVPMRIVAAYRHDMEMPCTADTRLEVGDEVFVLVGRENLRGMLYAITNPDRRVRRIMISGGGRVGARLADDLGEHFEVKVMDKSPERCHFLASTLPPRTLVIQGDGTDEELLLAENVADMDLFVAISSDDEDNILAAMLAKRLGARRVIALVNRPAYAELLQGSTVDIALSPAQVVIGELLMHARRGAVAAVHSLRRGRSEAMEGIARGNSTTSHVVGKRIEQIKLPPGVRIGAIVRGASSERRTLIPHHDTVIESDDHIIIFLPHKRMVKKVEKLFQVRATFF